MRADIRMCAYALIVAYMYSIHIDRAIKDDTQIFAERVPSDIHVTPLCSGDVVDLMCFMMHSNGHYVQKDQLDCLWTCTKGVIKGQHHDDIMSIESEVRPDLYIQGWVCSVYVPALCNCSCKWDGKDKIAGIEISAYGE